MLDIYKPTGIRSEESRREREKRNKPKMTSNLNEKAVSKEKTESKETTGSKEKSTSKEKTASKEQFGSRDIGSREGQDAVYKDGKDEQVKRRGAMYHEEEGPSFEFGVGRRGSSASGEEVRGGSSSDEYKRRLHELKEKNLEENISDDKASICFYKVLVVVLAIVILLLTAVLTLYLEIKSKELKVEEGKLRSLEVMRNRFGVMSENLDCSIHMRRRRLQNDDYQTVVRQGLMCLYALAPHTVHEDSSFQLLLSYTQSYPGMVEWLTRRPETPLCPLNKTRKCALRSLWSLMTGYIYTGKFNESELTSVWFEEGSTNLSRQAGIWSRTHWRREVKFLDSPRISRRKFKVPRLLVKLARRTTNAAELLKHWNKRFPNIDLEKISTNDTITITEEEAALAASIFARKSKRRTFIQNLSEIWLTDDILRGRLKIFYPTPAANRRNTLSFMAAFVVRVVVAARKELNSRRVSPLPLIEVFTATALKVAVKHFRETRYWTGNPKNKTITAAAYSEALNQIVNRVYDRKPLKIKRNATDRVSSILIWERSNYQDAMLMLELSLPHLFDPTAGTGLPAEYPRFVHDDGEKSLPLMSSAGLLLNLNKEGNTRGVMAASASGSEGTVQGVADAILAMIYLGKAGEAADSKQVYLDLSDGRIHCSKLGDQHFRAWYGMNCDVVDNRKPDRRVMAMISDRNYSEFASMAMTEEDDDYNYAVGF